MSVLKRKGLLDNPRYGVYSLPPGSSRNEEERAPTELETAISDMEDALEIFGEAFRGLLAAVKRHAQGE
jgi:hypothetical protein